MNDISIIDQDSPKRSIVTLIYLITMSIIVGAAGILSIIPAMFSVMMLDAPDAVKQPATVALAASVGFYPIISFAALASSWKAYSNDRRGLASALILLPCINLIVGGLAYLYIDTFRNGQLT